MKRSLLRCEVTINFSFNKKKLIEIHFTPDRCTCFCCIVLYDMSSCPLPATDSRYSFTFSQYLGLSLVLFKIKALPEGSKTGPSSNFIVGWYMSLIAIYRRFLSCSHHNLGLIIPNNMTPEHWRLSVTFITIDLNQALNLTYT